MQGSPLANGTEKHPDTNWNSIDWHQEERRVRNLRQRIFRATQAGDWKRVVVDPQQGELTLLDVCSQITQHEIGHLVQIRNLIALLPEP